MYHGHTMGAQTLDTVVNQPGGTALLPRSSSYPHHPKYYGTDDVTRPFLPPATAANPLYQDPYMQDPYMQASGRDYSFESSVGAVAFCWETLCCCCPFYCTKDSGDDGGFETMPWGSFRSRPGTEGPKNGSSALTQEVYRKIREVDNQTSTLTNAGAQGLSARILDKFEYRHDQPDGTPETLMCQTAEIIKKPGQSLGVFLREGNGVDKQDGVFVSRLGENSEFTKYGDILKPGDEILTVNNVDVSHMSIDDVVVIMSIPRRLLLRIRYSAKSRRPLQSILKDDSQPAQNLYSGSSSSKPVVVLKRGHPLGYGSDSVHDRMTRDESAESGLDTLAGPTPTAHTSLGMKARQQLEELQRMRAQGRTSGMDVYGPTQLMEKKMQPRRSNSDRWTSNGSKPANALYSTLPHRPRVIAPTLSYPSTSTANLNPILHPRLQQTINEPLINPGAYGYLPGGATLPRRFTTAHAGASSNIAPNVFSPRSAMSDSMADYQRSFATGYQPPSVIPPQQFVPEQPVRPYGFRGPPPPLPPKPVLRQPSSAFPTNYIPHIDGLFPGQKSNSLPRRNQGPIRSVKWKNDFHGGVLCGVDVASDSDGAASAPEFPLSPSSARSRHIYANLQPFAPPWSFVPPPSSPRIDDTSIKTVDEIFSAQEYKQWAGGGRRPLLRDSPWNNGRQRSSSMPPRGLLENIPSVGITPPDYPLPQSINYDPRNPAHQRYSMPPMLSPVAQWIPQSAGIDPAVYTRLDVSPLLNRRKAAPLQTAGPGWNVDDDLTGSDLCTPPDRPINDFIEPSTSRYNRMVASDYASYPQRQSQPEFRAQRELIGMLVIHIVEGRGLKVPERQKEWSDELYCVLEIDGEHRARTGVSTWSQRFQWNETFEIDCFKVHQTDFYVYSWHPQLRHKLCHRASLKLFETFFGDRDSEEKRFALNLEPRGQLLIRTSFLPLNIVFRRPIALRRAAYFGVDLPSLVERECSGLDVPIMMRRLVEEIERRGVDSAAIYMLCGAAEKKRELRDQIEKSPMSVDFSADSVPDTNVLTSVLKDWLRELPSPLVPGCIYQMLVDAYRVCLPNDSHANARLMLGVLDCMPRINKCTMMVLMDHFKAVSSHAPHNGVSQLKLCIMFGPLLCCTAHPRFALPPDIAASAAAAGLAELSTKSTPVDPLNAELASQVLNILLDMWPGRASTSESSGSDNSTINLTNNGAISLLDVWLQEHQIPESHC